MMKLRYLLPAWAVALGSLALAVGTPADTEVTNQASATYNDSSGAARATTSNQVVTIVQQVHAFTITPDGATTAPGQSKNVLAGANAYFNYVVANGGNGADTIRLEPTDDTADDQFDFASTSTTVDGNCNGTIDTGETTVTSLTLDADASACIILTGTTPSGETAGATANVDLQGTYANGGPESGNWARAVITESAALDARMGITPNGEAQAGDRLALTIEGSNVGAAAAHGVDVAPYTGVVGERGIVVTQTLPTDVTFAGGLTGNAGGGAVKPVYYDGANWSTTAPADLTTVERVGVVITGTDAFFAQTASYTYAFQVNVDDGVAAGAVITHPAAQVQYSPNGTDTETSESNPVSVTIGRTYGALVGPFGDAGGTSTSATIVEHGEWDVTIPVADEQQIAVATSPVYTGDTVTFKHTLRNAGNTQDSFTLSVANKPVPWTCSFVHADGATPISGSVGPFPSTDEFDFMLSCSIPQANVNAEVNATRLTVSATSVNDTNATDGTIDEVPTVQAGYSVDVTSNAADALAGGSLLPGDTIEVPFEVTNTGGNDDVYNLSGIAPAGWNVVIYEDATCDDAADTTIATRTERLADGEQACFVGHVLVPETADPAADRDMGFEARSTTDTQIFDTVVGAYWVDTLASISLNPNQNGTVTTPGTISYDLELRNASNGAATVDIASVHLSDLTYQFSTDGTTWSNTLTGVNVDPRDGIALHVRVIVPAGQPLGRIETQQIEAAASFSRHDGATVTDSDTATITSTVVGGELTLTKTARTCSALPCTGNVTDATGGSAEPGDYLEYQLVAKNIGTDDITEVIVMDPLPSYTTFESILATTTETYDDGTGAAVLFSSDGSTWTTDPTTLAVTAGSAVYVGIDTDADAVLGVGDDDALEPGETINITLTVQLQ